MENPKELSETSNPPVVPVKKSAGFYEEEQLQKGFEIAVDKLRKMLLFSISYPTNDFHVHGLGKDEPQKPKAAIETNDAEVPKLSDRRKYYKQFRLSIRALHNEIFTACGYVAWLKRNTPFPYRQIVDEFRGDDNNKAVQERKLRDLILRETIWTCAEQLRHCPQRLNHIFHEMKEKNKSWYDSTDIQWVDWFWKSRKIYNKLKLPPPPDIDYSLLRDGIKQFMDAELNFDDIDDCGKWRDPLKKTYVEPPGATLFFLIIKYNSGIIQLKLWIVAILFYLHEFKFTMPTEDSPKVGNPKFYQFPFLLGFVFMDIILMVLLWINELFIRFIIVRERRWDNLSKPMVFKYLLSSFKPPIALGGLFGVIYGLYGGDIIVGIKNCAWYYIAARGVLALIPEFLPYSATTTLSRAIMKPDRKFNLNMWKGLKRRHGARVAFFFLLMIMSAIYEYFLVVPVISDLFKVVYCGDDSFNYSFVLWNSQKTICLVSTALLWFNVLMSIAIDIGLVFILGMAFVGWIRGYQTQGASRALVQLSHDALVEQFAKRFITDCKPFKKMKKESENPTAPPSPLSTNDGYAPLPDEENPGDTGTDLHIPKEKVNEYAEKMWFWSVDYWRSTDLISDAEAEWLRKSPTIDCSLLGSPDAQKHISFFLGTLNVAPNKNLDFFEILPLTVLIPVYEEKLAFTWVSKEGGGIITNPKAEFRHLVGKYPEEWLNFIERIRHKFPFPRPLPKVKSAYQDDEDDDAVPVLYDLEDYVELMADRWALVEEKKELPDDKLPEDEVEIMNLVTEWLSMHDQYVERTIKGACSYYDALVQLGMYQGGLSLDEARVLARQKLQVVICAQIYKEPAMRASYAKVVKKWLRDFPCVEIVCDYNYAKDEFDKKSKSFNPEVAENMRDCEHYKYATVHITWNHKENKIQWNPLMRENVLLIKDKNGDRLQGKSQNQVNGMTFVFGRYIQVLDANQGGHATEYLKFPSLLQNFYLNPSSGDVRYRIIGSREYIFTKNLGTVARCHAYQEWSFGTLILRTYSDLGIRLHYGHPDVFHGSWALGHSGLSKVNPNINTSEDVFAGFETMKCQENTKHVEHIQFQKGRETGLANMSSFDSKISQGNSGILRSRDMYNLMERQDFVMNFLFFQGVAGHFITISLMMWSMKLYILSLILMSLSGASLKGISQGSNIYSSEWLFHAGLTTVIPLIVEFMVEYGPVIGVIQSLAFFPVSILIYLFQMQTKHFAFMKSIFTGRAAHINTGRGLMIYRYSLVQLFKFYGQTHFYPMMYIICMTLAYKAVSGALGGGTLPLIMIYLLCVAILTAPQIFNPSFTNNSLTDVGNDLMKFVVWVGKTEDNMFLNQWVQYDQLEKRNSFLSYWIVKDISDLPQSIPEAIRSLIYHLLMLSFWGGFTTMVLYPHYQFWVVFFLVFFSINVLLYGLIFYFLKTYEQPLRIMVIFLGNGAVMLYFILLYAKYNVLSIVDLYISILICAKILEQVRAILLDIAVIVSLKTKKIDSKTKLSFFLSLINKFFFVMAGRMLFAVLWGIGNAIIGLLMRPFISNLFLFGKGSNDRDFSLLKPLRRHRAKRSKFGVEKAFY
eukprot:TRINITY_DN3731_c0_g1_i4.p1 TRINITY_DN3731_c0_g1~~TRINITY_DN3731_c0_g1_i4.p1  ORF type:complete len:1585 (-),score=371.74 TRINITY_DN3731_c0_g1_i4:112-4866(-)